jgi:Family of unknown function (DUF695)
MEFESLARALAEGEFDGHPLLIRFRSFPQDFERTAFPERINVCWAMSDPDKQGLATPEEAMQLEAFEDRLVEAVESDQHSVLSVVLTCEGKREFVFHTADVAGFLQRLTDMPQEDLRYPIELHHSEDAEWEYDASIIPSERPCVGSRHDPCPRTARSGNSRSRIAFLIAAVHPRNIRRRKLRNRSAIDHSARLNNSCVPG